LLAPVVRFQPVEPISSLKKNTELAGFKVIHTPGPYCREYLFISAGKVLFAGDALRSDRSGNPKLPSK